MNFIFIVGQHRTGSTLLKNMLNAHSEVSMAFDEMNLFEPLRTNTLNMFLNKGEEHIIDLIKSKKVYGTFWQEFEKSGISYESLQNQLASCSDVNARNVISAVLEQLRINNRTLFSGVKYPLHIGKAPILKKWFPESKILFLTRNPKAVIASKLNDPASKKRKKKSMVHRFAIHYFTLFYFAFEYRKSVKIYFSNQDNFHLVTYENLVTQKKAVLKSICDFCEIDFENEMLNANGKESSFRQVRKPEFPKKYKIVLNRFDIALINMLTKKSHNKILNESNAGL